MKELIAAGLQKGDLFYYRDRYYEALSDKQHNTKLAAYIKVKCIMSPTPTREEQEGNHVIDVGTITYIINYVTVKLLVRDDVTC